MIVNNELERIWKEVIMAYFEVVSQSFSGGSEIPTVGLISVLAEIQTKHLPTRSLKCYCLDVVLNDMQTLF
jgi:hypothetical protein